MDDDAQLAQAIRAGRPEAFRTLIERYERRVFGLIAALVSNRRDVEDLAQDVFLTAWTKFDQYSAERGSLASWLLAMARNRAVSFQPQAPAVAGCFSRAF